MKFWGKGGKTYQESEILGEGGKTCQENEILGKWWEKNIAGK